MRCPPGRGSPQFRKPTENFDVKIEVKPQVAFILLSGPFIFGPLSYRLYHPTDMFGYPLLKIDNQHFQNLYFRGYENFVLGAGLF